MPNTDSNQTANPAVDNGSSRKEATTESEGSYRAKRYALKYQPPCIFLEYEDTTKRRRVRAVKLNGLQANVDVDRLTRKVIRSFPRRLDPTSVKYDQVRRLVVSLVDFLNGGASGKDASNPGTAAAGAGTVVNGHAPGRNGAASHVPSRLGPGGSGSGATAATGSKPSNCHPNLNHSDGASNGGASVPSPLPSMSPRVGSTARLAISAQNGVLCRDSVESTMSRFSTSTASPSSSSGGGGSSSSDEEEGDRSGCGGRSAGRGLASALDELEKEMAALGDSMSDISTMATNGGGGSSLGISSEMVDSRTSSFSVLDKALPPLPPPLAGASATPAPSRAGSSLDPATAGGGAGVAGGGGRSRFAAEAEKLVIGMELTDDLDLNKVTEVELRLAKQAMEEDFKKHQLKPGDLGYVYDKQVEFVQPTEANDWDDSDDDEQDMAASEEPEVDWDDIHASVSKPKGTFTAVQVNAGLSSGDDGHSPYNSNDWP